MVLILPCLLWHYAILYKLFYLEDKKYAEIGLYPNEAKIGAVIVEAKKEDIKISFKSEYLKVLINPRLAIFINRLVLELFRLVLSNFDKRSVAFFRIPI